jgi:biuret amidohydrolase
MPADRAAVLALHFQNEIVDPAGTIARRGNAAQIAERQVLQNTGRLLAHARSNRMPVLHVGSGYTAGYPELNRNVPLFSEHEKHGSMQVGTWGAAFHPAVAPADGEPQVYHGGIGVFAGTGIQKLLIERGVGRLLVAGVSTRLVVEAVVFEATDRGYPVSVVQDCCASASAELHSGALRVLAMFATIVSVDDVVGVADGEADGVADPVADPVRPAQRRPSAP